MEKTLVLSNSVAVRSGYKLECCRYVVRETAQFRWLFSFDIIPITHLFKNGKLVYTFYGAVEREELFEVIDKTPEELDRMQKEFYYEDDYDAEEDDVATISE